jgi:hypothetical protein
MRRINRSSTAPAPRAAQVLPGGAQNGAYQLPLAVEDQPWMIDVVVVVAVEERQLLRPVGRILGAVDVEHYHLGVGRQSIDPALFELLEQGFDGPHVGRVLKPRQCRL